MRLCLSCDSVSPSAKERPLTFCHKRDANAVNSVVHYLGILPFQEGNAFSSCSVAVRSGKTFSILAEAANAKEPS